MNVGKISRGFRFKGSLVRIADKSAHFETRLFSSTSKVQKHGPVPKLAEASNPELQAILTDLREKVMLPAHLSQEQERMIFDKKHKKRLEEQEIMANLDGELFRLRHLDKQKDVPSARKLTREAVTLMQKEDWHNVPNLCQGLMPKSLSPHDRIMIMKVATRHDRFDVILECFRRGSNTGWKLNNVELAFKAFQHLCQKALFFDKHTKEISKTLSWMEQLAALMEEPAHKIPPNQVVIDPRSHPAVLGSLLTTAALRSKRYWNSMDKVGKVDGYAKKLLGRQAFEKLTLKTVDEEVEAALQAQEAGSPIPKPRMDNRYGKINVSHWREGRMSSWFRVYMPTFYGMKLALTILDPSSETAQRLREQVEELEPCVEEIKGRLEKFSASKERPLQALLAVAAYEEVLSTDYEAASDTESSSSIESL